jgi:hypothetical protein
MSSSSLEAWGLVRQMLDDLTGTIVEDAETDLEVQDGLRVLARATALCEEISVDADPAQPRFFSMNTPMRYIGGPCPDGEYHLGMIDGGLRYRIEGRRNSSAYLGFQVLAGRGMEPRRQAVYVSDRDLVLDGDGGFALVLAADDPGGDGGGQWVQIPEDASAVVVRQYVSMPAEEEVASYTIEVLDPPPPSVPDDDALAGQLTAMAWTIAKLVTLHRTITPELVGDPNRFVTAEAAALGSADTTPDNLYMIGTWRIGPDEALVVDAVPPASRFWSLTIENIWHECFDVHRRPISVTGGAAAVRDDGSVRMVIADRDPGVPNWLDTGSRHRGWMLFRWLDNPDAPEVSARVVPVSEVGGLP